MSNLDTAPVESTCPAVALGTSPAPVTLSPREVPLGGPRAMAVRRTLPHRDIRTIGAWCFVDDYGPTTPADPPMAVPPHPHCGLQTVTWLLSGSVAHRDSTGGAGTVRPGELNLMTSGWGITHSEYSAQGTPVRGVQMWVALPDQSRHVQPGFAHHDDLPRLNLATVDGPDLDAVVILGSFAGATSPARCYSPLVGVELTATGASEAVLALDPAFEYGILVLDDPVSVAGESLQPGDLRYLGWGADTVTLRATGPATVLLLGGEPMAEDLLMWWNFVGRNHDDIVSAREDWESGAARFGDVVGDPAERLRAPILPNATLRPRPGRRLPPPGGNSAT